MNFGMGMPMMRSSDVKDLKELKSPEEGGTKKQHDEFEEKIKDHIFEVKNLILAEPYGKKKKNVKCMM